MYQRKHWKQSCYFCGVLTTPQYLHEDDIEFNHTEHLGCHFRPSSVWALIRGMWHGVVLTFAFCCWFFSPCKKSNGFRRESSNSNIKTKLESCNLSFIIFFVYLLNFCVFLWSTFCLSFWLLKGANRKWKKSVTFHVIHFFFILSTQKEPIQYASMNISKVFVLRDLSKGGQKFAKRKLEKTRRSVDNWRLGQLDLEGTTFYSFPKC